MKIITAGIKSLLTQKLSLWQWCLAGVLGISLAGCSSLVGTNPGPPTGVEKLLYNTTTNYQPIIQVVTNFQYVTQTVTNVVPVTNVQGITVYNTNVVTQTITNQVLGTVTNQQPQYTESLKPGVSTAVQAGGGVLNTLFPGIGAMATQGVIALLGAWGWWRSNKQGNTSGALAQEIEAIRTFVRTLPNGAAYDTAFVNFMQAHQTEAGVIQNVADMLDKVISDPNAQAASTQISQFIQQLQLVTPIVPVPPVTPPPATPKPVTG